jgi:hypothetical protein
VANAPRHAAADRGIACVTIGIGIAASLRGAGRIPGIAASRARRTGCTASPREHAFPGWPPARGAERVR